MGSGPPLDRGLIQELAGECWCLVLRRAGRAADRHGPTWPKSLGTLWPQSRVSLAELFLLLGQAYLPLGLNAPRGAN